MAFMDRISSSEGASSAGKVESIGWHSMSWESRGVDNGCSVEMYNERRRRPYGLGS
jgi:hypothetical protein